VLAQRVGDVHPTQWAFWYLLEEVGAYVKTTKEIFTTRLSERPRSERLLSVDLKTAESEYLNYASVNTDVADDIIAVYGDRLARIYFGCYRLHQSPE
jgi:hypothetical protein